MGLKKLIKNTLKYSLITALSLSAGASLFSNYVAYKTLKRNSDTKPIFFRNNRDFNKLFETVKTAEGKNLEEKIKNVINEDIIFSKKEGSEKFNKQLFAYLDDKFCYQKGDSLAIKDKIKYARSFSSNLSYNVPANFIEYIHDDNGKRKVSKIIESISENLKLWSMNPEKMINYENGVLCRQYAETFNAALNSINNSCANPEKIHAGIIDYVANYERDDYGKWLNRILSLSNAVVFSEGINSIPHSRNIAVTEDMMYIIEAKEKILEVYPKEIVLDINNKYAGPLK